MGRIKTKKIKRTTQRIFKDLKDSITANFDDNKKVIQGGYTFNSKKMRNVVAGYCTRLKKQQE